MPSLPPNPVDNIASCGDPLCTMCGPDRIVIDETYFARVRAEREAAEAAMLRARRREQQEYARLNDLNTGLDEDVKRGAVLDCECEACKFKSGVPSKISRGVIHQYSYRPSVLNFNSVPNDPYNYFIGVELETDNHNREMSAEFAADIRLPKRFWFPKHDGSVSGPEFVSHPATITYWKRNRAKFKEMFETLLHSGYSSHNGGHCGMHINIGKEAFAGDAGHIFRFLTLLTVNTEWSLTMSQRTFSQMQSWAQMNGFTNERDRKAAADAMAAGRSNGLGHTAMLGTPMEGSMTSHTGRFEFRLPRGTLNIDRFFMKLEWTVAMIEYSRTVKAKAKMTPKKFMAWVIENRATEFKDLVAFIYEKGLMPAPVVEEVNA